jgi:hypothetical protein
MNECQTSEWLHDAALRDHRYWNAGAHVKNML